MITRKRYQVIAEMPLRPATFTQEHWKEAAADLLTVAVPEGDPAPVFKRRYHEIKRMITPQRGDHPHYGRQVWLDVILELLEITAEDAKNLTDDGGAALAGHAVVVVCTECGADNLPEFKFCGQCGKPRKEVKAPEKPAGPAQQSELIAAAAQVDKKPERQSKIDAPNVGSGIK